MYKISLRLRWFILVIMISSSNAVLSQLWNPAHKIGTITGVYHYSVSQTPAQLVEIFPAGIPNTGLSYLWEQSTAPTAGFGPASGTNSSSAYNFSGALTQTMYYRRRTTNGLFQSIYSNIVKISVVSATWEDINYVREHEVLTTGINTWTGVDNLAIGQKLQITTYLDGIGRPVEKVSRETATPPTNPNDPWGDVVQFAQYDAYGRQPLQYLPYTTTTQSGKFKTTQLTEQSQYYTNVYNETSAFSTVTFDNSPLNRVVNIKESGSVWAASAGTSGSYDMNTLADDVHIFSVSYIQGNAPINNGVYPANTLYKLSTTDENGKLVVEFRTKSGQLILKKIQLDNAPSATYTGWICTYYVYDDFGQVFFEIQPEGVKYLDANGWSFAGTNGQTILAEQTFQYFYDDQGRMVWKKIAGALPVNMIYDTRDRIVFRQDGNQSALATPQWSATIYDDLDRTVITTLYNTTKTIAALKTDISNAAAATTVTIANTANNGGGAPINVVTSLNPISSGDLNNSTTTVVLSYQFYDNYSFSAVKTFDNNYTNLSAYNTSDPNVIPIAKSVRTTSMCTGAKTRILGTNTFLAMSYYYDERAQPIQTLEDNIKTGVDITTMQYYFDGRVLSSCSDHTTPSTGYTNFKILTKHLFDKLGRTASIQKQFGSNAFKTVVSYDYDDMGRVKTKHLDPGYTAGGNADLESLNYSFNIHSQLIGINKDYALKNPVNYNKWGHFFGLYLGFDNRDNVFANTQLMGQASGQLWNTQGDDAQRKYDYTYDNAGRLVTATYNEKQHTGDSWSNSQMDFSVKGTSGSITYDLNGNLLNMLQRGVIPGTVSPIDIDNLVYAYASYSNKLQSVTDQMTSTAVNGQFGDLKDGTNGANPDYVYDNNGNVVIDLNKNAKDLAGVVGANGIKYNFLDKPEQIRIAGKGTIQIVYSADGEKLQRSFTPEPSGPTVTTSYIHQFVYQETSGGGGATLQYINFEAGRIRVLSPTSQNNGLDALVVDGNMDLPNSKRGAYDFYIVDYLQNVRMILTEETHIASNTCTMETIRSGVEEPIFGQTGGGNEVSATRFTKPVAWTGNTSSSVSQLGTNAGHNIGPNTLQKVMAGDKITASVQYYYQSTPGGNNTGFVSTMLGSLVQAISGGSATTNLVKGNASSISTQLNGVTGFVNAVQPNGSNPGGTTPQAYLTILFFDERFKFIEAADGGVAQQQVAASVGSNGAPLGLNNVKAPKNGYVYVYVSNQSNNDVYFDDLIVGVTTGNIIEENHYYAYGMKITALSSKKVSDSYEGNLKNNYQYQGAYSEMDDDIGWNDFALRSYDPQIGRWMQMDPYDEFPSPYGGMGDDPVNSTDPSGGDLLPVKLILQVGGGMSQTAETAITLAEVVVRATRPVAMASSAVSVLTKINVGLRIIITAANVGSIINNMNVSVPVGEVLAYGQSKSTKFSSLMTATGITVQNTSKIVVTTQVTDPIMYEKKIYVPPIPTKETGVIWLAHEMSNLAKWDQNYKIDEELSTQLVNKKKDPKTKVMTADEFATKKINLEAKSVEDRIIVEAESGIPALDPTEQKAVNEYKKTKNVTKLRQAAKKITENSKTGPKADVKIRDYWKGEYERIKKVIAERQD